MSDALALAAGELAERAVGAVGEADVGERARGARGALVRGPGAATTAASQRAHQRDVERADREVEPRALGLRHDADARRRAASVPARGRSSPSSARKSVVLPPPLGPRTAMRSPGVRGEA